MDFFKKIIPYIIILLLVIPTVVPLFSSGFFPMHDDTQPTRVAQMFQALNDGQFPVRWVADLGYGFGYPIFNFYAPLAYYIGAIFMFLGFDALLATKLMCGLGMLLSATTMLLLGRKWFGNWGGLFASLLYVFGPYHAVQLYVRGAVGELWAYAFLPLVVYGFVPVQKNKRQQWVIGVIGISGVILSHNINAYITLLFVSVYCLGSLLFALLKKTSLSSFWFQLSVLIVSLGLTSFFWLPAVSEAGLTRVSELTTGTNNFRNHFVYADQLWNSPWGYAGSAAGRLDGMSFMLGKIHMLLSIVTGLLTILFFGSYFKKIKTKILLCGIGLLVSVFMMLSISQKVWEVIPGFAFIQYPWRFLTWALLFSSLLGGALVSQYAANLKAQRLFLVVMISGLCVLIGYNQKYFKPQFINKKTALDYTDPQKIQTTISAISDEYLPRLFPETKKLSGSIPEKITVADGIIIERSEIKSHRWHVQLTGATGGAVQFSIAYFPNWRFFVDHHEVKPFIKDGLPIITVSPGAHALTLYDADTLIRQIANLLSLVALTVVLSIIVSQNSWGLQTRKV